jgi:hypothetical protein
MKKLFSLKSTKMFKEKRDAKRFKKKKKPLTTTQKLVKHH